MASRTSDGGTESAARAVTEKIFHAYAATRAGGISWHHEREICHPVTEAANSCDFSAIHLLDVDEFLERIPVCFSARVSEAAHGGYQATLVCQTNLDEPEYAYWEFREFLKQLGGVTYLGRFSLGSCASRKDGSHEGLRYEYRFPIPADGDVSLSVIETVVTRFLIDTFHAATGYFDNFCHVWSGTVIGRRPFDNGTEDREGGNVHRIIPFPTNRRNRGG